MEAYAPLVNQLMSQGIHVEVKNETVNLNLDRMAGLRFINTDLEIYSRIGVKAKAIEALNRHINRDDPSFCGGDLEELKRNLNGEMDLKPYFIKYDSLKKSGLISKLKTKGALGKPRRKRKMSEHDGEWDFDRKWELKPYQGTIRKKQLRKSIKIYANFSCSGSSGAREITEYGALIWAITKIIEDSGIQVEVYYQERANRVDVNLSVSTNVLMRLKKAGEYISPQALAASFTANHYRRLGFALQTIAVAACGNRVTSRGMGCAPKGTKPISFSEGILTLDKKDNQINYDEIEKVILGIINGKENNEER